MSRNAWTSRSNNDGCLVVIVALLLLAFAFVIGPLLVMWLWNWVAVDLFAAPVIGFWEAFAMKWLCNLLFGTHITIKRD